MKCIKVYSKINHTKINKGNKLDFMGTYFLLDTSKLNKDDKHYQALQIIRELDSQANATQVATDEEVNNGIIFN